MRQGLGQQTQQLWRCKADVEAGRAAVATTAPLRQTNKHTHQEN